MRLPFHASIQDLPTMGSVTLGGVTGAVKAADLRALGQEYALLTAGECQPQLAVLAYGLQANLDILHPYFPLTRTLDAVQKGSFNDLVTHISGHRNFEVKLYGLGMLDLTGSLPAGVRQMAAGHLAEVFFFRRDILARYLSRTQRIHFYTTRAAFQADGGKGGGDYHTGRSAIRLVLGRLFEGMNGPMPGICPFLHELGHALEFFEAFSGTTFYGSGLLPGLSRKDGKLYTPEAARLFREGRKLERKRYHYWTSGRGMVGDPQPLGNPYVFINRHEFCAGYFEMFFRNPNAFAERNAALYQAYVTLLGWDPRKGWEQDFPKYLTENQAAYQLGKKLPKTPLIF